MTQHELKIYIDVENKASSFSKHWVPLVWAGTIVSKARKEGRIRDDFAVKTLVDEINTVRARCGSVFDYDWISIPLVYTQVNKAYCICFYMILISFAWIQFAERFFLGHDSLYTVQQ